MSGCRHYARSAFRARGPSQRVGCGGARGPECRPGRNADQHVGEVQTILTQFASATLAERFRHISSSIIIIGRVAR